VQHQGRAVDHASKPQSGADDPIHLLFHLRQKQIDLPNICYYNKGMKIEFDPDKNQRNIAERQLSFELAGDFEWETSLIWEDKRQDYGESRFSALGYVGMRLYHLTFTLRDDRIRVISLRKANRREVQRYAET
jgi:uncharacterized protein